MSWIVAVGAVVLAVVVVLGIAQEPDASLLNEIRSEMIPAEGMPTAYGIPLSLSSLPQFVEWWYTLVPGAESDARYVDALSALVAPCCDDNTALKCCCETDGKACNIIRSGKGLAAYLIVEHNYDVDAVQASVLEWFRFARPDYYLAAELEARNVNPMPYGLTTEGSCYRQMCNVPISRGGCGGMGALNEPAIAAADNS
jgi:hypothetical protein